MTSNPADIAIEIFQQEKGHCSQAIFASYGEHLGLGKVDFDTCMRISSAFSGGIALTGNVCGALTGALMSLGLKFGDDVNQVNVHAVKLLDEFKSLHGSIICRELIDHDLTTDEQIKQAFATGAFDNCPKYIEDVTKLMDAAVKE